MSLVHKNNKEKKNRQHLYQKKIIFLIQIKKTLQPKSCIKNERVPV